MEKLNNEMAFLLAILKSPEIEYNANSLAKHLGISSMGALKIANKLVKEDVLIYRKVGNIKVYRINFEDEYALHYLRFALKKEHLFSPSYVKVWIRELGKIKSAEAIILFGSVLRKGRDANDIDALIIVKDGKSLKQVDDEIAEIDKINIKKIHPIYQSIGDLKRNIKKGDKVVLNAVKGMWVYGTDLIIEEVK